MPKLAAWEMLVALVIRASSPATPSLSTEIKPLDRRPVEVLKVAEDEIV